MSAKKCYCCGDQPTVTSSDPVEAEFCQDCLDQGCLDDDLREDVEQWLAENEETDHDAHGR